MATTINSTALDFNSIKTNLKTFIKSKSEFADYDFEASGLSNVLDVLAYNTHYNGLIANFALNETFLDTAQLRSSIVSHAEALGYEPRSITSSKGVIKVSTTISAGGRPSTISLPRGTKFNATVDGKTYTFHTREAFTAADASGTYQFKTTAGSENIDVFEGTEKSKTFIVGETDERQIYVIPDPTIDTSTIIVTVYDNTNTTTGNEYTNLKKAVTINTTSKHYEIKEVPNGYFELAFGDGKATGTVPTAGNKIVVDYLSTSGTAANGATSFTAVDTLTVDGSEYNLTAEKVSNSTGGADKESLESIRNNARTAFSSQQRLVTAQDYEALILSNYSADVSDVSAWGGEENDPVKYGTVYIGLQYVGTPTDSQKTIIQDTIKTNLLTPLSIIGVDPVFVNATQLNLELTTIYNFDPNLTGLTINATSTQVNNTITDYFNNNLGKFDNVFRRSLLLAEIDDIDDSILNSRMSIKCQLLATVSTTTKSNINLSFPMQIAAADDKEYRVTSGSFVFKTKNCSIKNKLGSTTLQVIAADNSIVLDNVGEYYPGTGKVTLNDFIVDSIIDADTSTAGDQLKISVVPANESTIRPLRNYVINLDASMLSTNAVVDYQNTQSTL